MSITEREQLATRLRVARGEEPADLVLAGGKVVDVFSGAIRETDVALHDGVVAGLGDYKGQQRVDLKGAYLAPGFIEGHLHVESTMLCPAQLALAVALLRSSCRSSVSGSRSSKHPSPGVVPGICTIKPRDLPRVGLDFAIRVIEPLRHAKREAMTLGPSTMAAWTAPSHWRTRPATASKGVSHVRARHVRSLG